MTYADSGFVVSLYRPTEKRTQEARLAIQDAALPVFLSPLSLLEIRNAFNLAIQRGEIQEEGRKIVLDDIDRQLASGYFQMAEVSQSDIYAKARELSDRYTPIYSTRSLDLMHVAAAILSQARVFLSTDARQRKAATAEGLDVRP